jgi:hypothetical protein
MGFFWPLSRGKKVTHALYNRFVQASRHLCTLANMA